ncbi:uncharacterized protein LOC131846454 [Achroia grisella]|uniref:uncharacterized protein LOC131846454 n=1 Tax=Achroia grisella TaxID=688607 RepID=UPI0027D2B0B2|nr:uncharacterized protein LOC131846454 [Achroia grisella]
MTKTLHKDCNLPTIHLQKEAMQELDSRQYILSLPKPTRVQVRCDREDFETIQGSYLVTIPINCLLRTEEFTIINSNDEIKGRPLKILNVPYDVAAQQPVYIHTNVNSINLEELHTIQDEIIAEPSIQLNKIPDTIYHTTIPFYVILFSIIVLLILLVTRHYKKHKSNKPEPFRTEKDHRDAIPVNTGDHGKIPATFSLNVLK